MIRAEAESPPPAAEEIAEIDTWIELLDDDRYAVRANATEQLIETKQPVAEAVAGVLGRATSLELVTRGLYVLQQRALSGDAEQEEQAWQALEKLSASPTSPLSLQIKSSLSSVRAVKRERAIATLAHLGGQFELSLRAFNEGPTLSMHLGPQWRGGKEAVAAFRWLTNVRKVILEGPQFDDDLLRDLTGLEGLEHLVLVKTPTTAAGLNLVSQFSHLHTLETYYIPLTDEGLLSLSKLPCQLRLIGTGNDVTPQTIEEVKQKLLKRLDYRPGGGFLGIIPDARPDGKIVINDLVPQSAAHRAGLRKDDRVIQYNGTDVQKSQQGVEWLIEKIGRDRPKDIVKVRIERDGEVHTIDVELDEWHWQR